MDEELQDWLPGDLPPHRAILACRCHWDLSWRRSGRKGGTVSYAVRVLATLTIAWMVHEIGDLIAHSPLDAVGMLNQASSGGSRQDAHRPTSSVSVVHHLVDQILSGCVRAATTWSLVER
jgi:hypothetical protein